ncbi:hypothetical protein BGY98DRAFT_283290 [Russula aff. rugulosa BPL654]|nr:hypothetical protein BGY98DRAFT_283290 [Russula aff. rugulosa BPL654]
MWAPEYSTFDLFWILDNLFNVHGGMLIYCLLKNLNTMDGISRSLGLDDGLVTQSFFESWMTPISKTSVFISRLTAATMLMLVLLGNHIALSLLKSFLSGSQAGGL